MAKRQTMAKKTDNGPQNITQKNNTNLTKNGGGGV